MLLGKLDASLLGNLAQLDCEAAFRARKHF